MKQIEIKPLYLAIIFIVFKLFFVTWVIHNILDTKKEKSQNEDYLKKNKYYIAGNINSVKHLNAHFHMFYINFDTIAIVKQDITNNNFLGLINYQTNEAVLFACMSYYDWREEANENLLPDRISINTELDQILYFKNDTVVGDDKIEINTYISRPIFEKKIKYLLKDRSLVKF